MVARGDRAQQMVAVEVARLVQGVRLQSVKRLKNCDVYVDGARLRVDAGGKAHVST